MPGNTAHPLGILAPFQKSAGGANIRPAEAGHYDRCLYMIVVGSSSGVSEPRA